MSEQNNQYPNFPVELHEYKLKELKETTEEHEHRIKMLEEAKSETKMEFASIRKELSDQKSLALELDMRSREKYEKLFNKILENQDVQFNKIIESQNKRETDNDEKMSKFVDKLIDSQNKDKTNTFEITKSRLAIILGIITGIVTIVTMLIEKFAPIITK